MHNYVYNFLIGPYRRPEIIAIYLLLVPILGYSMVSVSLIDDVSSWRDLQKDASIQKVPSELRYATTVTVQSNLGQTVIRYYDVAFISVETPNCLVHHQQGVYKLIGKTVTEVEADLNPNQFFRANRGCLVNRAFVEGYVHTGNNNYIINLKAPFSRSVVSLSRTRLSIFRDWLHSSIEK